MIKMEEEREWKAEMRKIGGGKRWQGTTVMWLGILLCGQKVLLSNVGIKINYGGNEKEYEQSRDIKCRVVCSEKDTLEPELEGTSNIQQTFCDQHNPSKYKLNHIVYNGPTRDNLSFIFLYL
jgi:hypothetical protein